MKRLALTFSVLLAGATAAAAMEDPIATRQALMQANGASAGAAGAMLKGEMDYNPVVARAAIATMHAVSSSYGDYFPEGSAEGDTRASPKIWEDMEGFKQALAKFHEATTNAVQASGRDGPADLDAFKAAVGPVFATCQGCHENYRVQN